MTQTDVQRVAITGMGLVTSLGMNAPSSLAAIRSGIANFTEHETVVVHGDADGTELCGAAIARLPELSIPRRIHGMDRFLALIAPAIKECSVGLPHDLCSKVVWRIEGPMAADREALASRLNNRLPDLPISERAASDAADPGLGRCLFFENLIRAASDLRNGDASLVMVGCFDSLCDNSRLEHLLDADRLKSATNPEGLIAGEAAGAFLLELESHAKKRGADILAYLTGWGRGEESHPWHGNHPSTACGLRSAFAESFAPLGHKGEEIDVVIADLNGERARGSEWAYGASRIFPRGDKERELMHPADCTGDCGAAMGAVLLATALDMFSGTSTPAHIALSTSDDNGARRVLCIGKGDVSYRQPVVFLEPGRAQPPLSAVLDQHNDDASFLWFARRRLLNAPHKGIGDLKLHDERLQANLDGLFCAGDSGWESAETSISLGEAGDFFVASYLAFKSGHKDRIDYLFDKAGARPNPYKGIISALGWLPYRDVERHIDPLLTAEEPLQRYVGIAASAIHRRDPGHLLDSAAVDSYPILRGRALMAYGELGRVERQDLGILQSSLTEPDFRVRFPAAWSATLAGCAEAVHVLRQFVFPGSGLQAEAISLLLRRMPREAALSWQRDLAQSGDTMRTAVTAAGILGDPVLIPWLLEQMTDRRLARLAGEAFYAITGLDVASAGMEDTSADGSVAEPHDDARDHDAAMDPDAGLAWPRVETVNEWWEKNKADYGEGNRRLLGRPVTENPLQHILLSGPLGYRSAAALELALLNPGKPLYEVRASFFRQFCGVTE